MTDIDYAARVQRGIALLDEKWPAWATEINLDVLRIESGDHCVTAQYAGLKYGDWHFATGMVKLGLDSAAYGAHGFNVAPGDYPSYSTLDDLWKAAALARRAEVHPEASER